MTKICTKCNLDLLLDNFSPRRDSHNGYKSRCKSCCNKDHKTSYLSNVEKQRKRSRDKYYKFKEKYNFKQKEYQIKNREARNEYAIRYRYNLSKEELNSMIEAQNNRCGICNTDRPGKNRNRLIVDHCHISNTIRGLLCAKCNTGLGLLGDTIESVEKAVTYLKKSYNR